VPDLLEAGGLRAGLVSGPAGHPQAGPGSGISQATAYRYKDEAVEQGLPYLILDGTPISSDRCADKKTSKKGKEIAKWHSGQAHEPAGTRRP
jgi:hypothetical protein